MSVLLIKSDSPYKLSYFCPENKLQIIIIVRLYFAMLLILPFCYTKGPVEECEYGYYGTNCRQTCGKCAGASQCDHVTGECANGCMPGYFSALCTEGKLLTNFLVPHTIPGLFVVAVNI